MQKSEFPARLGKVAPAVLNNATSPPTSLEQAVAVTRYTNDLGWNTFGITPQDTVPEQRIFYIHGGAFVMHMLDQHWRAVSDISVRSNAEVTIPAYPLAPAATAEYTPYAMANSLASYLQTTDRERTALIGDSAGGNLALTALTLLRDRKVSLPASTILISPWLNLELADIENITAPGMNVGNLRQDARSWRGGLEFSDRLVSPLNASLDGLGSIAVFCGTNDVVYPGCQQLAKAAADQPGTNVEFYEAFGAGHSHVLNDTPAGQEGRAMINAIVAGQRPDTASLQYHIRTQQIWSDVRLA